MDGQGHGQNPHHARGTPLHRLARDHRELVGERAQVTSPQGRFAAGAVGNVLRATAPLPAAQRATVAEADGRMVDKQSHWRACGTPVESWTLDGRTAHACPARQPR